MKLIVLVIVGYLIVINLISGILFASDKISAKKSRPRVPESTLHLLELAGGVFANLILMYFIRHKNRKFSYWIWTWIILIIWIVFLSEKYLFGV